MSSIYRINILITSPGFLLIEILDNPVKLSGQEVLPGFLLDLHRVWDWPMPKRIMEKAMPGLMIQAPDNYPHLPILIRVGFLLWPQVWDVGRGVLGVGVQTSDASGATRGEFNSPSDAARSWGFPPWATASRQVRSRSVSKGESRCSAHRPMRHSRFAWLTGADTGSAHRPKTKTALHCLPIFCSESYFPSTVLLTLLS